MGYWNRYLCPGSHQGLDSANVCGRRRRYRHHSAMVDESIMPMD